MTFSAPKSVSVLFGLGDDRLRGEALAAHDAAVAAVISWVEAHAHCRYRVKGEVAVFDAEGIVAAAFREHTSRALDPQVHTHVVIANRVMSPDGRWLALDARTIKVDQRTLSALYHAALRAELTARLCVGWREPVNGIAEMAAMPDQLLAAFSARSDDIDRRLEEKLQRFEQAFDRQPTPRERWRLEREAVTDSRPAKTSIDAAELRGEWEARAAALGIDWVTLEHGTVGGVGEQRELDDEAVRDVVERAIAALTEKQSTWRPAELVRELAAALPTDLTLPAGEVAPWLDQLADRVIAWRAVDLSRPVPAGALVRASDARPVSESAVDRVLTFPEVLVEEEHVLDLASRWVADGGDGSPPVTAAGDHGVTGAVTGDRTNLVSGDRTGRVTAAGDHPRLSAEQRAVAVAVAGDQRLVLIVGPAGTGKTTALEPAIRALTAGGRPVFGVAPSATAAEVLSVDCGVDADTLDKLLIEHTLTRPPQRRYDLPAGATVLVDEAAMVATPALARLFDLAHRHRWRLVLVGDPRQFSAVGRGGLFAHLVDTLDAVELAEVHRFREPWEAQASLRLRRGDLTVVDVCDRHGRLHAGTATRMRARILQAWWNATRAGQTAAMMAPTTEAVVALNHQAQQLRVDAGELAVDGPSLAAGPYRVHVGDVIATRRNDRTLRTDRNQMVKNRDHWTITATGEDGSITAAGRTGTVTLPAGYVARHVELAYAETSHANQGRTVDRSYVLLDGPTNAAGIYVPLTRGRRSNEAFVVAHGEDTAAGILTESLTRTWVDRPAVEVRSQSAATAEPGVSARPLPAPVVRQLLERAHELDHDASRATWKLDQARRELDRILQRQAALRRTVGDYEARIAASHAALDAHDRPLHRRRHRRELDAARAQLAWIPDALDTARREVAGLSAREDAARRRFAAAGEEARANGQLGERIAVDARLERDRRARARDAADDDEVIAELGPRPASPSGGDVWDDAAGRLAQRRAAFGPDTADTRRHTLADTAEATSARAVEAAVVRLDRLTGRDRGVDDSLGLSL